MKYLVWVLMFIPSMLIGQTPQKPTTDTVVTIIKRTPNIVTCAPCVKKDSVDHARLYALIEELKRQKQAPVQNSGSTLTKVTAVTSTLALAGVVWLLLKGKSNSNNGWPKDTDDEMELKP